MNLAFGKIIVQEEREQIVSELSKIVWKTLSQTKLSASVVINACDKLSGSIGESHIELLKSLSIPEEKIRQYLQEARVMLGKDYLLRRMKKELGADYNLEHAFAAKENRLEVTERINPLGTLLHIMAGNQQGLALYSVIEGLLTGNINLVKLSGKDDGLSVFALKALVEIEPLLADYIYVFDYRSADRDALARLMEVADAVVLWGGDEAVKSVRQMAAPDTKLIEWGHKISFAYITKRGMRKDRLRGLAENMIKTGQLLCSSCQGIYLDTDSMEEVFRLCDEFLPLLDQCGKAMGIEVPIEIQAQNAIRLYVESLESPKRPCKIFRGEKTSITAYEDHKLEPSIMHGNCWAKRLESKDMISVLRPNKNHLQTAALLCADDERDRLIEKLWAAGITRITDGETMSEQYCGSAHDGEYPLRRYIRIVSIEKTIADIEEDEI